MFKWYEDSAVATSGMKADGALDVVDSFAAEGSIDAGAPVTRGTNPEKQVKVAGASDKVIGVALFAHVDGAKQTTYESGDAVSVMSFGDVYVEAGSDIVAGDTAAIVEVDGAVKFVASGTASASKVDGAEYISSASKGELVAIRLRK